MYKRQVWGRNTSFYDGSDGLEMRNEYPNAYIEAYYDFTEENTGTGMTFSRAGTAGVQSTGVFLSLIHIFQMKGQERWVNYDS